MQNSCYKMACWGFVALFPLAATGQARASSFQILHSFTGGADGGNPKAGFVTAGNLLYGAAYGGGDYGQGCIYSITPSGTETVLHSFTGADGSEPVGGLLYKGRAVYLATLNGGADNDGVAVKVALDGRATVLHDFGGAGDGSLPAGLGSPVAIGNTGFITTEYGGAARAGTVTSVTSTGLTTVLHSFGAAPGDGLLPTAALVNVHGTLYGTTMAGGTSGNGTVFAVTLSPASYNVIYSFSGGSDGAQPLAPLIEANGLLYGTTLDGGANNAGTVFSVSPSGTETVLHAFLNGNDGANPYAGLVRVGNLFYGAALNGGIGGHGTLFAITADGTVTVVLHNFAGGSDDGAGPVSGLTMLGGTLYGTTVEGGANNNGTVYAFTP